MKAIELEVHSSPRLVSFSSYNSEFFSQHFFFYEFEYFKPQFYTMFKLISNYQSFGKITLFFLGAHIKGPSNTLMTLLMSQACVTKLGAKSLLKYSKYNYLVNALRHQQRTTEIYCTDSGSNIRHRRTAPHEHLDTSNVKSIGQNQDFYTHHHIKRTC